ncbi:DUF192 domain-containing protein [Amaricoccus macauensis]|uniref:DUF192 domain-containing protein n=1 Tax=Amaricoccus macauensis TaxID=57001 RepID=UPI003C7A69EB
MKHHIFAAGATLLAGWLAAGAGLAAECAPGQLDLRDADSVLRFRVEVADDAAERSQGLMHVEEMPRMAGMLFVYPEAQPVSFWMRNTLISLDMLFFDETGTLAHIHENAVPLDETPIPGGSDIRYVLEINGGLAETFGIEEGAELRSPAIDQERAAWPCG